MILELAPGSSSDAYLRTRYGSVHPLRAWYRPVHLIRAAMVLELAPGPSRPVPWEGRDDPGACSRIFKAVRLGRAALILELAPGSTRPVR